MARRELSEINTKTRDRLHEKETDLPTRLPVFDEEECIKCVRDTVYRKCV